MIADVPLGAFLSGGIDSSTIVALMRLRAPPGQDVHDRLRRGRLERGGQATQVARHLGTDHTELYVTARRAVV